MLHEKVTTLTGTEVLARAKTFFAERVPHFGAFPDEEGSTWATFRGQGGEEIALAVFPDDGGTRVRASSLLFGQTVDRFLSTLPVAGEEAV
jgi:hypothetical protein